VADRRAAYGYGRFAEARCAWGLRFKGYRILARRHRSPAGEIDIIARRGSTLAFIEVKARQSLDTALESVTPRQQRRIRDAAELYVARHPQLGGLDLRFDVMLVVGWRWPRHILDAWRD
jgi:putative endonuclease